MKTAFVLAGALALAAPLAIPKDAQAQVSIQFVQRQPGQWVQLGDGSVIFVPQNAPQYYVGNVPYVYMYRRGYGWNWYASPWGGGPFVYNGGWRARPWPYGHQTWHPRYDHGRPYGGHYRYYGGERHHH